MILNNVGKLIDKEITIQKYNIKNINSKYFEEAKRLLPENKYIGISLTQGNAYRKKTWSLNKSNLNSYQQAIVYHFTNIGKRPFGSASWTVVEPNCHFTK